MALSYKIRDFTNDETDVWGAISALNALHTTATPQAIQEFTGLSKTRTTYILRTLKSCGLITAAKEAK